MKIIKAILVTILYYFSYVSLVSAASFEGIGVFPKSYSPGNANSSSRFELELYPGESFSDSIRISNKTGKETTFSIFTADGLTTKDGAFTLEPENTKMQYIGKWIKLSKSEVSIKNGEQAFVNFEINIPKNIPAGDYLGGISVYEKNPKKPENNNNGIQLQIKTRVGVRVYVTVPGELKKNLELTKFSGKLDSKSDTVNFDFGLKNNGNVRLEPKGEIKVINYFTGNVEETFPIDLRTVLPEKPTEVPIKWKNTPILGKYVVRAQVNYGDKINEVIEDEIEISYITKKAKIIFLTTIVIISILILFLIKKATSTKVKGI